MHTCIHLFRDLASEQHGTWPVWAVDIPKAHGTPTLLKAAERCGQRMVELLLEDSLSPLSFPGMSKTPVHR